MEHSERHHSPAEEENLTEEEIAAIKVTVDEYLNIHNPSRAIEFLRKSRNPIVIGEFCLQIRDAYQPGDGMAFHALAEIIEKLL